MDTTAQHPVRLTDKLEIITANCHKTTISHPGRLNCWYCDMIGKVQLVIFQQGTV